MDDVSGDEGLEIEEDKDADVEIHNSSVKVKAGW